MFSSRRQLGAVEHVAVEQVALASLTARGLVAAMQRLEELLHVLWMAVVGVQGDEDVILRGQNVHGLGQHDGTQGHVFDRRAGGKLTTACADLDDAVRLALGECLQRAVDRGQGGHVDGRVGIAAFLSGVEHGVILGGSGDWHGCGSR